MPYSIDRKNKCVYKKNPDGSRGKKVGCTKGSLKKYLAALYVNEEDCCKEMSLRRIFEKINSKINLQESASIEFDEIFKELGKDNDLSQLTRGMSEFDEYDKVDVNSDEFREFVYDKFAELYDNLYSYLDSSELRLWRRIDVNDSVLQTILKGNANLGIYWAYEKDAAQTYFNTTGKNEILVGAFVDNADIDWIKTFTVKLEVDIADDEKEIRLKPNKNLKIFEFTVNNKNMLNRIVGKEYKS